MPDVKQRMIDIVNSVPEENTLYDMLYDLFFFADLQESEDDIKNGRVCTLKELNEFIDELEANYANNTVK